LLVLQFPQQKSIISELIQQLPLEAGAEKIRLRRKMPEYF